MGLVGLRLRTCKRNQAINCFQQIVLENKHLKYVLGNYELRCESDIF